MVNAGMGYKGITKIIVKDGSRMKGKDAKKKKIEKVMHEFKEGALKSGSKKGPEVTNRKQAVAIALSEAKKGKK